MKATLADAAVAGFQKFGETRYGKGLFSRNRAFVLFAVDTADFAEDIAEGKGTTSLVWNNHWGVPKNSTAPGNSFTVFALLL